MKFIFFEKIRFHNDFTFLFDTISFVNWNRHRDKEDDDLTSVRTLSDRREVLVLASIVIWTLAFGFRSCYISDRLPADFLDGNLNPEVSICFFDAFVSVLGVVNGVFIWLRFREQWIAWFLCAILEMVINILSGQYVLLVPKLGHMTNTVCGYLCWTHYIGTAKDGRCAGDGSGGGASALPNSKGFRKYEASAIMVRG